MMKVIEISSKKDWEAFLQKKYTGLYPFFQSWDFGEVQKLLGVSVTRLALKSNDDIIGTAQIYEINAKRGKYLHLRHGPILEPFTQKNTKIFLDAIKKLAKEKKCSFVRISPWIPKTPTWESFFHSLGFRNAPIHNMDAEICWVLDITPPEEEILSQMRKSHRYLIKKALKESISILKITKDGEEVEQFLTLYKQLAQSRGFVPHKGLIEELNLLGKNDEAVLFLAKFDGKIIGGALIDFVGTQAIYHHGAFDDAYRNLSVSYLLQWEAIKEAKKRGKKIYNFWGIASNESKKHPWYGLTLFKTGFGGERKDFLHAMDLPLSIVYIKAFLIDIFTKIRKGY